MPGCPADDKQGSVYYYYNNTVSESQQTVFLKTIWFRQYRVKLSEIRQNQKQTIDERETGCINGGSGMHAYDGPPIGDAGSETAGERTA